MQRNKTLVTVMTLALAFSVVLGAAVSVQADPPGNATCSQQCDALGDLGGTHGACVSFCTSCLNRGNTSANCTCNFLEYLGILGDYYKNYGQCIKDLK